VALVCPGTAPVLGKAGDHGPCSSWDILCVSVQPRIVVHYLGGAGHSH
jgi:hypothetical protein